MKMFNVIGLFNGQRDSYRIFRKNTATLKDKKKSKLYMIYGAKFDFNHMKIKSRIFNQKQNTN